MPVYREVRKWVDYFDRAQSLSTTPGHNGWTVKDTSATGTPTYAIIDGGQMELATDATAEAQIVTMYHNNIEVFDIDDLQYFEVIAKVSGIDSVTTLVMGLADAQNDTADSVATNVWFRMEGSASTSNVVVETDDGTTDNDDKATGKTLASTYKKLHCSFEYGKTDIRFYIDNDRVASSTTFSMSAASGKLQPFIQLQKASGTGTPKVTIAKFEIGYVKVI